MACFENTFFSSSEEKERLEDFFYENLDEGQGVSGAPGVTEVPRAPEVPGAPGVLEALGDSPEALNFQPPSDADIAEVGN